MVHDYRMPHTWIVCMPYEHRTQYIRYYYHTIVVSYEYRMNALINRTHIRYNSNEHTTDRTVIRLQTGTARTWSYDNRRSIRLFSGILNVHVWCIRWKGRCIRWKVNAYDTLDGAYGTKGDAYDRKDDAYDWFSGRPCLYMYVPYDRKDDAYDTNDDAHDRKTVDTMETTTIR